MIPARGAPAGWWSCDPWPGRGRRELSGEEWYNADMLVRVAIQPAGTDDGRRPAVPAPSLAPTVDPWVYAPEDMLQELMQLWSLVEDGGGWEDWTE